MHTHGHNNNQVTVQQYHDKKKEDKVCHECIRVSDMHITDG